MSTAKPIPTLSIAGESCPLVWDKSAMYRADELGAFGTQGIGFARAAKYVWAMVPDAVRKSYKTPAEIAHALPPITEVNAAIDAAIKAAGPEMDAKNVFGSTSGRSRSSS